MNPTLKQTIFTLYEKNVFKFGDFTLKSGLKTPLYIDLRLIISYPDLLDEISQLFINEIRKNQIKCDNICGVPYTALPIATCISLKSKLPMVMRRKEVKNYGTKKLIEGIFKFGDKCLIIEDLVTSGSSTMETARALQNSGLIVTDAIVLLDREQGGKENLMKNGITLHSVCKVTEILEILKPKLDKSTIQKVGDYFKQTKSAAIIQTKRKSYEERAINCNNELTKKLFNLMAIKKSNIAIAIDVTSCHKLLQLADEIGPYICILKIHIDILEDFTNDFITKLKEIALKHNFFIMEDRKFADIGFTVQKQFQNGIYRISEWADFITVHGLPGPGILTGLKGSSKCSIFLIAQMSSKGNLTTDEYAQHITSMATDDIVGFISQSKVTNNDSFINAIPGVNLKNNGDCFGQNYITPSDAIVNRNADIIIVGRGIINANDVKIAAEEYRQIAWKAYENTIN